MSQLLSISARISTRGLCHFASALAFAATVPFGCQGSVESSDVIEGTGGAAGHAGTGGTSTGGWAGSAGMGGAAGTGNAGGYAGSGNAAGWAGTGNAGGYAGSGNAAGWAGTGNAGGYAGSGNAAGWAGTGNAGGYAGTGGGPDIPCMPGSIAPCSCSSSTAGTHTCTPDGAGYGLCVCAQTETDVLVWFRTQIVGSWSGIGTNPWQDPYEVVFEFRPDGTYFAKCVQTTNCLALYYGEDVDSPLRTYVLDDVKANHLAQGQIAQVFGNQVDYDAMLDVAIDESAQHLWFSVMNQGIYGPITMDLHRTGP